MVSPIRAIELVSYAFVLSFVDGLVMDRRAAWAGMISPAFVLPPVLAYERRDVGGEGRSAATAAMNIQAYETNNRLERDGVKLETEAEQKASLANALADYSYAPSTATDDKSKKNKSSKATKK